ncbi:MAG TPA: EAL domain-containing protein [Thermoanaerobaculia bacterium]|nr:EAL domain-containing protein [Thermoanaerobaculia bacterium]
MPTLTTFQALGLHFLGPFAVALLLFQIHRSFGRSYTSHWTRSFSALAIFHFATAAIVIGGEASGHINHGLLMLTSAVGGGAAYLQVGWLIWGCFELARRKPVRIRESNRLLAVLLGAGVLSGIIPFLLGGEAALHRFFYLGLHALAAGATFTLCGAAIWRYRGAGFAIPVFSFVAYGGLQFYSFVLIMRSLVGRTAMPMDSVAVASVFGSGIIALGLVLAVLEDQREAAALATSQVEHLAYYDTLTGLPNRSLFGDRLAVALTHAARHHYKLAVLFLDIDRFKGINDSLGHTMGDRLLRTVATRIRGAVREEDTVARFGGDEFTVLIHIIGKIEDAGKIAQKILDSLKAPIIIDEREFVVTSSIGISIYPMDGTDGETLIRNADTAMYRSKDLGGNTYQFYAASMNHKAVEALEVENGLRRALAQQEFVLYYQPLVDVRSGTVFGLEALIRWNHPQLGLLRPDRFIPAAEESGLIIPMGRWVLREACRQANEWHRRGHRVVVAVNLSGRQFQDPDLIRQVREALDAADLRAEYLELEITEGYAMQDVEKAIQTLRQLKALGVRIAIDDFGTGYSCLSYLKQFPIDTLKLDGSFVRDLSTPEDAQIALGVIALAHSLKLKVIAEGVETIGQMSFLREHACDRLQGYLFSRPMPAANFERFINQKDAFKFSSVSH